MDYETKYDLILPSQIYNNHINLKDFSLKLYCGFQFINQQVIEKFSIYRLYNLK